MCRPTTRSPWRFVACLAGTLLAADLASAAALFDTRIRFGDQVATTYTNSATRLPYLFDSASLPPLLPGYQPTIDSFSARLDLRGLRASLAWDPGPGTLTLLALGRSVTFTEANLDAAIGDFDDWLHGDFETPTASLTLTDLLQGLVAQSPVDPVAGNPNSLQSRFFQTDFRLGTQAAFFGEQPTGQRPTAAGWDHTFGLGFDYGYASGGSYAVEALDLPIEYRVDLPAPKWSLLFSLPITATLTEGQWSFLASAGAGVQYRPFDWWSLTPMVRAGGAGSLDVGALGVLYSATLTSQMRHEWRGISFALGNLVGFTKTVDGIEIGGFELTYDLTNAILTNGLSMSGDTGLVWCRAKLGWTLFGWNTQILGADVYMDSQTEIGARLGLGSVFRTTPDYARSVEIGYAFGNGDYDALVLRLRLRF